MNALLILILGAAPAFAEEGPVLRCFDEGRYQAWKSFPMKGGYDTDETGDLIKDGELQASFKQCLFENAGGAVVRCRDAQGQWHGMAAEQGYGVDSAGLLTKDGAPLGSHRDCLRGNVVESRIVCSVAGRPADRIWPSIPLYYIGSGGRLVERKSGRTMPGYQACQRQYSNELVRAGPAGSALEPGTSTPDGSPGKTRIPDILERVRVRPWGDR